VSGPWLAIDTATEIASVALGSAERVRTVRSMQGARQHAAHIVPLVDQVLTLSAVRARNLALVIVADGPGSFTGLRIGWAAAKGLAHANGIPLRAIPSLMGAAHAAAAGAAGPIAVCFDALRGQVFGAVYAFPPGRVETLVAPGLFTVGTLARAAPVQPVAAVGDGALRYPEEVLRWTGRPPVSLESVPPVASSLLALGAREGYLAPAEPEYGRPAEAQAKWEARHGRPLPNSSR
jgi:tRNA threonylcarbamoyladenosine biosynthesis protein TsaB